MFPKIIHQIWYQGIDKVPHDLQENSIKIKQIHPTWQYILWDDTLIREKFIDKQGIIDTYNILPYLHNKVDFIRYCILHEFGGVYMDMDITILKTFDDIIEENKLYECILSDLRLNKFESLIICGAKKCINNGIIISKPKSEFMLSLVDGIKLNNIRKWYDFTDSLYVNRITGPEFISKKYINYKNTDNIKLLDWSYFEPCLLGDLCEIKDNTITIHHHNTTWINKYITTVFYYFFKYKPISYIILCILCLFFIILIYRIVN